MATTMLSFDNFLFFLTSWSDISFFSWSQKCTRPERTRTTQNTSRLVHRPAVHLCSSEFPLYFREGWQRSDTLSCHHLHHYNYHDCLDHRYHRDRHNHHDHHHDHKNDAGWEGQVIHEGGRGASLCLRVKRSSTARGSAGLIMIMMVI